MNLLDLFLREHAAVHSKAALGGDFTMDWVLDGLSDEQLRAMPHGMNSIAWLLWHLARVEDSCIGVAVCGETPLLDDGWVARLGVDHRTTDGEGMTKEQVAALSASVDLTALREYRDAVGRRTRELVRAMWPDRFTSPLTAEELQSAHERGAVGMNEATWLVGKPRDELLFWWAVGHNHNHLGQMALLRTQLKA